MKTKATLFIGQAAGQVHAELQKVGQRVGVEASSALVVDQEFVASESGHCHLPRCGGKCMMCWNEKCFSCKKSEEEMRKAMRKTIEELDMLSDVTIVGETGGQFAQWAWQHILDDILDDFAPVALNSIVLRPSHAISGVDAFHSARVMAAVLDHSTSIMIRGPEDFFFEDEIEQSRKTSGAARILTHSDYLHWLACDLWFVVNHHAGTGQYSMWPHMVLSPTRLFDVRTSLHRTLHKVSSAAKGSRKNIDIAPARIVSSALHRLHLCYQEAYSTSFAALSMTTRIASSSFIRVDASRNRFFFALQPAVDPSTGVHWATKGLKWMLYEDICEHVLSSTMTNLESAFDPKGLLGSVPISALVFQSPYAELDLLTLARRTRALVDVGAFRHLVERDTGGSWEDVEDATLVIETFLGDLVDST